MDRAEPNNDAELLLDQTAWVKGLARSLAIDASGADDVAQEAMLAAWQTRDSSDRDLAGLRTWLTGVVRNLSNLRVRGESRRRVREEWVARPEPTPSVAETVSRAAQLRLVVDEVMDLDEPHRSAILLRYFDGLSTQQVAETMECSPEAARKRLSRALRKLRERLDQKHGGDGASWLTALTPFLGDLAPGSGAGGLAVGAQGAGKLSSAGWSAVGSVAAGAALLVGGGMLYSGGPDERPIELAVALSPTIAPLTTSPSAGERDRSVRVPLAPSGSDNASLPLEQPVDQDIPGTSLPGDEVPFAPQVRPQPSASGHVFDLAATPVQGVEVFRAGPLSERLAMTLGDGSFEAMLGIRDGQDLHLVARSDRHATLRAARVQDLALHVEPIIIVAPRVDLAGQVVDEAGQPLDDVHISLAVSDMVLHGFPHPLQSTVPVERNFDAHSDGRFQLDGWVTAVGLSLNVERPGYESLVLAVPDHSDLDMRIMLSRSPLQVLHGVVLHRNGEPASLAQVQLGPYSAPVGGQGLFRLEYRAVAPETALRASSPGFVPSRIASFGARLASADAGVLPVRIVLGGPARSIAGVIHDPDGQPVEGWETFAIAADGAGALMAMAGHQEGRHSVSSADGRFLLTGLSEADYVVHAVNRETLIVLTSDVVRAGEASRIELEVPENPYTSVRGRIVARDGAPLVGARVTVVLDQAFLAGEMEMVVDPDAYTDSLGGFSLAQVPLAFVDLRVEHPDVFAMTLDLQSATDMNALEFEVPRDRFIQLDEAGDGAVSFEVFGGRGQRI
ncbi:MAG: RNA polymerase sigma-70 factor (ECF subfamily), partial [Gammaproteobacteria bacterium]